MVPRVGIEPTRPKPSDFESDVSTSSTTEASLHRNVEWNFTKSMLKDGLTNMASFFHLNIDFGLQDVKRKCLNFENDNLRYFIMHLFYCVIISSLINIKRKSGK